MANNTIKGLTVEIGGDTTKLGKALENVNTKSRDLSKELGQINKLLKMDPGNADLLAQKQKVLTDAVAETSKKLEILEEAERQVQEQFKRGEVSEAQVRELQREIIETTQKMERYEQAVKETADALEALGDDAKDAAKGVDKVGDAADDAEAETKDMDASLEDAAGAFAAVTAAATAVIGAIVGCVEASQEYRREMGKLTTAFETSGHSQEAAKETYKELQSILGETDQAVEASNMLAKLVDNEADLREMTHALTGVYATFGASLPIEALAESANESARNGQIAGNLADAINWASEAGETFGVKLKKATKANEEWNKAVEEATTAEEFFNLALQECSTVQERQQLITKTLTKLYGNAGTQYKKTNKDVIAANKANEDWNETVAELGEELAPTVAEVKKFGAEMVKSAKEPLKDAAEILTDDLLPALTSFGGWVRNNAPIIKTSIVGATAALVAYKVAVFSAEASQKGLKGAIMATTVAQKALNLAQAATPWGLAAVAITGVVTALTVYGAMTSETAEKVDALTEEERELMEAADKTAEAFREQRAATAENAGSITAQMGHVQDLAAELQSLADASGEVKEKDEARAQFILNELNEALGTEYTMTDGVIQKYADLKKGIDAVIQSKTANALLEANNALYVEAIQAEDQAIKDLVLSEKDYQAQLPVTQEAERVASEARAAFMKKTAEAKTEADYRMLASEAQYVDGLEAKAKQERDLLDEKKKEYDEAALNYGAYSTTIMNYEEAQTAALGGNYDRAVEILRNKSGNYEDYADNVDQATRDAIDALYKEAVNAGIEADRTKRNFENGIEGYTKEMVDESEQAYDDAMAAWAEAYDSAHKVGDDLGGGLKAGMEGTRSSLISKAKSLVSNIISAMRKEADSHSPAQKTIDFGEDMGEGTEIGMENATPDILKTARKQVQGIMATYQDESEDLGQTAARGVAERASTRTTKGFETILAGNNTKLDQILKAIENGQILTIDGEALIGATADRYDNKLGQKRILAARGAL